MMFTVAAFSSSLLGDHATEACFLFHPLSRSTRGFFLCFPNIIYFFPVGCQLMFERCRIASFTFRSHKQLLFITLNLLEPFILKYVLTTFLHIFNVSTTELICVYLHLNTECCRFLITFVRYTKNIKHFQSYWLAPYKLKNDKNFYCRLHIRK